MVMIANFGGIDIAAVCITGGEPTDHDLIPLIVGLREARSR